MKFSNYFLLLAALYMVTMQNAFSQPPAIEWQNTIGGDADDFLWDIHQTTDGGYILGGYSRSSASGDKTEGVIGGPLQGYDYWVVKINSAGTVEWDNTIGGVGTDISISIQQTTDGGYILGGYSDSGISGDKSEANVNGFNDYWVVKLSSAGAIEWDNSIGGDKSDYLRTVLQTSDGGYLLGGYSDSGISGEKTEASQGFTDFWVVKLNSTGTITWQNTIGGSDNDQLLAMQEITGGYILGGITSSPVSGDITEATFALRDYCVIKINSSGDVVWQYTIGGNKDDNFTALQKTADGGFILGGYSDSGSTGDKTEGKIGQADYWVVKTDGNGAVEWDNTIGGTDQDYLRSVQQTTDHGYILGGQSYSGISGDKSEACRSPGFTDYWAVKLNSGGAVEWDKTLGGNSTDDLFSIGQTMDGGYILGGSSSSGISGEKTEATIGSKDYWIVKLFADGCGGVTVFADTDNDTYGDPTNSFFSVDCSVPSGYVTNNLDCNDMNAAVHFGAVEISNGIDDDCNGIIDDVICLAPEGLQAKVVTATSAKLKWDPASAAISYSLRYKETGTGTWILLNPKGHTKDIEGLSPNTGYVWQIKSVCGKNPKITSDWSTKQFFTTLPLKTSIENVQQIFLEIYPNPSSGNTTLHFNLTQSSNVTIKIFDVNGKEMSNVLNERLEAGDHSLPINTSPLSKGIYFVRLISENGIQNDKLIVQ